MIFSLYNEAHALKLLSRKGSEKGFRLIYDRYAIGVLRVGYKFLHSQQLAEDLVQDVFSRVWKHPEHFAKVDNFESYLFTVAKNLCLKNLRKLGQEKAAKREYLNRKVLAGNNIDEYIHDKEYAELVQKAVENLPPQQKRVFKLVRDQGLSHDDVAHQLALSPATVNNHVVRAIKFIKRHVLHHIASVAYLVVS